MRAVQCSLCISWCLHEGKVIFTYQSGLRDVEKQLPANADTIYMIGSVSKIWVSAALGILVDQGKMKWSDKVHTHIPESNPVGDPRIREEADIIDVLRHSAGFANPVVQLLGPNGMLLLKEEDFIDFVNNGPTKEGDSQRFNKSWCYSSMGYGLMANLVERVSGTTFASFVKERILRPLQMDRTVLFQSDYIHDDNVAYPYTKLDDGSFVKPRSDEWTSGKNISRLAAFGIRSSMSDMLKFAEAVTDAEQAETSKGPTITSNPLMQMTKIRKPYWTRPNEDQFQNETAFCAGWFRAVLPSSQLGWGSFNSRSRFNNEKSYLNLRESPKRLLVKHNGILEGSAAVINTFPETQSAVIGLTDGLSYGDASDWACQIQLENKLRIAKYYDQIETPWQEHRDVTQPEKAVEDYVGEYEGWNLTLSVSLGREGKLKVVFNGRRERPKTLDYYNIDQYTFKPANT